jgi:hypothetical protein
MKINKKLKYLFIYYHYYYYYYYYANISFKKKLMIENETTK